MPHTITQNSSTLSNSLSVPSDGIDPVNETSVDPVFQNLLNNTYYLSYTQLFTRPHLSTSSSNGTTVIVNPFSGLWVSTNNVAVSSANWVSLNNVSSVNLTSANLDIPGSFAANTWYYIYCYASGSPASPAFEISATAPDVTKTFKGTNVSRRYIGSFVTRAAGAITPFLMVDLDYFLDEGSPIVVGPVTAASPGVTTTISTSSAGFGYPPTAFIIKINARVVNDGNVGGAGNSGQATITYSPAGIGLRNPITVDFAQYTATPLVTSTSVIVEVPIATASIGVNITSNGTTAITVSNIGIGYKE